MAVVSPSTVSSSPPVSATVTQVPGNISVIFPLDSASSSPSVSAADFQFLGDHDRTLFDRSFITQFLPSYYDENANFDGVLHACAQLAQAIYFSKAVGEWHPAHYGATARGATSCHSLLVA
jgi:hypothetical protein